jgi:polyphosphate kinase 2 (PPK2 family)
MELQEGGAIMQTTPWVVVEADDKQTVEREFSQGEIVDKLPSKDHAVFLVQSP